MPEKAPDSRGNRRGLLPRLGCSALVFVAGLALADRALLGLGVPWASPPRVAHEPNLSRRNTTIEYDVAFATNSRGLRSPEIPLLKSDPRALRIVVTGDSFAEGLGVEAEETFCAGLPPRLSRPDRPVEVVNCGLTGTGPVEASRILFLRGLDYHPDLAVMTIYGNDLLAVPEGGGLDVERGADGTWRLNARRWLPPPGSFGKRAFEAVFPWTSRKIRFLLRERLWREQREMPLVDVVTDEARRRGIPEARIDAWRGSLPPELLAAADRGRFNGSYLAQGLLGSDDYVRALEVPEGGDTRRFETLARILGGVGDGLAAEGVRLAVVYLPLPLQHDPAVWPFFSRVGIEVRESWLAGPSRFETLLGGWAAGAGVPFLSLTERFREASARAPGSLNFPLDGHWNAAGHAVAAEAIADWLRKTGLVP